MGSPEVGGGDDMGGCFEVKAYLWSYLDHEIDGMTCNQLEAHLVVCESCRRRVRFDRHFKEVVRRCADPGPIPPERVQELLYRVKRRLASPPGT
jgi:mycothiol system anti-sigma-R factor